MSGCVIDMLEPVSKIRLLGIPSIIADIVGVPCSNRMGTGTVSFVTAFSGALRRKELSSFYLARVSLNRGFLFALPSCMSVDFSPEERETFERSLGFLFPGELVELAS